MFSKNGSLLYKYPVGKSNASYVIPAGVTNISDDAFHSCRYLVSISLPDSVTSIGADAFYNLPENSIIYHNKATTGLLYNRYSYSKTAVATKNVNGSYSFTSYVPNLILSKSNAPAGVNYNGWYNDVSLKTSVTSIKNEKNPTLWLKTDQLKWEIAEGNTLVISGNGNMQEYVSSAIPWSSYGSSITSVVIKNGVTSISSYAFLGFSQLTSVSIPNSVTSIGESAYSSCNHLTTVTIPENVTSIGGNAFYSSTGLASVTIFGSPIIGSSAFSNIAANSVIYSIKASAVDLSDKYTASRTALAVKNVDGSYTFKSAVTNLVLSESNAPSDVIFNGWFVDDGYTRQVTSIEKGTNPTLWLKSAKNWKFTIRYDANGADTGSVPVDGKNYVMNDCIVIPGNPGNLAKTNRTFSGWNTRADGRGTSYAAGDTFTITANTTLYAQWNLVEITDSLALKAGWNFISVPKSLDASFNTAGTFFGQIESSLGPGGILIYDPTVAGGWIRVSASERIEPLTGYWVQTKGDVVLPLIYSSAAPSLPPVKPVFAGWNAVGICAKEPVAAENAFINTDWVTAIPWNIAARDYSSSLINGGTGAYSSDHTISLGVGIWIYLNSDGTLIGLIA